MARIAASMSSAALQETGLDVTCGFMDIRRKPLSVVVVVAQPPSRQANHSWDA